MRKASEKYHPWKIWFSTAGELSVASILICGISGILIAIPYDIARPYSSISGFILSNPYAAFFRNLHYWSGQVFLLFFLVHIIDYLRQKAERAQKPGIWSRLSLSIIAAFFVMLTGFILKGDAESMQAKRILSTLLNAFPLGGSFLERISMGRGEDLQLIYVHHIATATIFLFIVIFEHIRRIWTRWKDLLLTLALLSVLSIIVSAPLHDGINPVLKGPWYFLGLQEILHWMPRPGWSWLIVAVALLLFFLLKYLKPGLASLSRYLLLVFAGAYLILTSIGFFFRGEAWEWALPWEEGQWALINPYQLGHISLLRKNTDWASVREQPMERKESCLACHAEMSGFSSAHDPQAIGCFSCHLGRPFSADKDIAHKGMIRVPGNLETAMLSCGGPSCHPDIVSRVDRSIMTTLSGMIQVNRFVFGETDTLDGLPHVMDLGQSAADNHFRDLCASCHLGNPKTETGPADLTMKGGGCNACHLDYHWSASREHRQWLASGRGEEDFPGSHPRLSIDIPDQRCFSCHSRSGRISTNYEGWHETLLQAHEVAGVDSLRVLQDMRVFRYVQEDVHHAAGMRCTDCHISWELMGDGNLYAHKEGQTRVACEDCHTAPRRNTLSGSHADEDIRRIASLKGLGLNNILMLKTLDQGLGLYNTRLEEDSMYLLRKSDGKRLELKPPARECSRGTVHERLDCATCHTAWAPSCIGCHNEYDPDERGFDLLDNRYVQGAWIEYVGKYLADMPSLGVRGSEGNERIVTATPGMILSIDKSSYTNEPGRQEYHRLFAPVSAHTIVRSSHSCRDCHNNPLALGFGRGELHYVSEGEKGFWIFHSRFAKREEDGLPEDAWTGFLDDRSGGATRTDLRALSLEEQRRILLVGTCLECHSEDSEIIRRSIFDFDRVLKGRSPECTPPSWSD